MPGKIDDTASTEYWEGMYSHKSYYYYIMGLTDVLSYCQGPIKDTYICYIYIRSYERQEENKRKIGQERSSMQQADYQCPSVHSMNARKCVHAQKPYPSQAFAHESSKRGGRGKRETGKTEARRLMERKAAQQKKNTSEELKQGLPRHSSGNKAGTPNFP